MDKSIKYHSAAEGVESLGTVVPGRLAASSTKALAKLAEALGGDVSGYVANRLRMSMEELREALAAEQVDGVALAAYNIERRAQAVVIGDQTGIGKGRQAAAMVRYGLLSGYLPVFFTDRYTLFSDMYRDCKALGIGKARPLVMNAGASVVDFDHALESEAENGEDEIWLGGDEDEGSQKQQEKLMEMYREHYEVVYKAPKKKALQEMFRKGDIPAETFDYLMVTYSQLKDARRDMTRLDFLQSLCEKHRVLFIFDEAHRGSSVSAGKLSVITQGINMILEATPQTQCVFLSATFAKRPENFVTFMRRTMLSALATESTLDKALRGGGVPMQEYVAAILAGEGQMIRREHSDEGMPAPVYTYLDADAVVHGEQFDKVMYFFREIVKLSDMVRTIVDFAQAQGELADFRCYPARAQLFYVNKVLLLSLKSRRVAQAAVDEVKRGRSVVIGMSDTLECVLRDVEADEEGGVRGDISALLLRLLDKAVRNSGAEGKHGGTVFDLVAKTDGLESPELTAMAEEIKDYYKYIRHSIEDEAFHLPISPIDVIRQLITREQFVAPSGDFINVRFEECTGRAHQLEYLSPDGDDDFVNARVVSRKKRHTNHVFNDFQNNHIDVMLINACGATGASAHAVETAEVPAEQVRQRKMLIVQNDLDVNTDLQKRGRINRTGQRSDLLPLYEYIITAIPSEKRLNMMLRAKLRSLSANTAGWQDQDRDQADFVDIDNKYGNEVANDYLSEHPELAAVLDLKGKTTASRLLAKTAMLSVAAQQEIVDELMAAYTALEAELRRVNQWDLEREFRDFEAEFVSEELFTTAKADTKLGGCSYLTTYKCRHKTYPLSYAVLKEQCQTAAEKYGKPYRDNPELQKQVRTYYSRQGKAVKRRFDERRALLHSGTKRILAGYCGDEGLAETWIQKACIPSDDWPEEYYGDIGQKKKGRQILRKLISYSNEYNHLLLREKRELKKRAQEKKRLIEILSAAEIGKGYADVGVLLASEDCPGRVVAVLKDIRFGKDEKNRFLPSRVELVFALTAVFTEIRINMVHNEKWSNYERLKEILNSWPWRDSAADWDGEIAANNNKIVERRIITGNILGAYVHPAIARLRPRFIAFSLKAKDGQEAGRQTGLLLPMDESRIREAIKNVSIPLNEGMKHATDFNASYAIAGLGVNFSLMPKMADGSGLDYVVSVADSSSREFEKDRRFDSLRQFFNASPVTSIYSDLKSEKKRKPLMHYQTGPMAYDSEPFQAIIQQLSQMDAVIIVPRNQLKWGEMRELASRSERIVDEPWKALDWKHEKPMPPVGRRLLVRISSPVVPKERKGKPVARHSEHYNLAKGTMALNGLPLAQRSTVDALRRNYMKWKKHYAETPSPGIYEEETHPSLYEQREICRELQEVIEGKNASSIVAFSKTLLEMLQGILDSEYLDPDGICLERFDEKMLFLSPGKAEAQAFLDDMPCSPALEAVRRCIQAYIDGATDIINSPDEW